MASAASENEVLLKEFYNDLNTLDIDRALTRFSNDFLYEDACMQKAWRGRAEFEPFLRGFMAAFPCQFSMEALVTTDDSYGISWRWDGKHTGDLPELNLTATGKIFNLRGGSIGKIENGKIKYNIDYWSIATLLAQLKD